MCIRDSLDDNGADRHRRDQPIALEEARFGRRPAWPDLGDEGSRRPDPRDELGVGRRIGAV